MTLLQLQPKIQRTMTPEPRLTEWCFIEILGEEEH